MKDNFSAMILTCVLVVTAFAATFLAYRYVSLMGQIQSYQAQVEQVNRNLAMMNQLANEAKAYAEKNKEMQAILEAVTPQQPASPAPAGRPAAK